jgi:putative alpha-1,2-mannosidase
MLTREVFRYQNSAVADVLFTSLIGNGGDTPNGSGGMIPSTAPPFAMTRWVAQTRQNYVSVTPYNYTDTTIHGFQGTHQPAIWMGESGQAVVVPGAGHVRSGFEERGMRFSHAKEVLTASYYNVELDALGGGKILAEQSASTFLLCLLIFYCVIPQLRIPHLLSSSNILNGSFSRRPPPLHIQLHSTTLHPS